MNTDDDDEEEGGEDWDEIVREIDVYLSPELSAQMHLLQFPLQAASSSGARSEMASPDVAMIKPQHAALQLEYPFPPNEGGSQGRRRIFESYQVPVVTHMALGRFDAFGSTLHLVPLSNVIQMRPSMEHIRQASEDEPEPEKVTSSISSSQPMESMNGSAAATKLMFQRPESERAATSRRSSYAYYQASKAAEPWIHLQVLPEPQQQQQQQLQYNGHNPLKGNKRPMSDCRDLDVNASYVKSLNYIPKATPATNQGDRTIPILPSSEITSVEEFTAPSHALTFNPTSIHITSSTQEQCLLPTAHVHTPSTPIPPLWKKDLTTIVTNLLQGPGVPIPYLVIRSRFPMISSHITDEDLLEALSSCALLVRGNFVLKSSLLPISNSLVADARDVILLILNKYGLVHRDALIHVLCPDSNTLSTTSTTHHYTNTTTTPITRPHVPPDVIHGILASIGRKVIHGVQLKVDDDTFVETYYPQFASLHALHWAKQEQRLSTWIQLYEELVFQKYGETAGD